MDSRTTLSEKHLLVGGFSTSEKYEFVSWDYYSQYMEKCSKPPTSLCDFEFSRKKLLAHSLIKPVEHPDPIKALLGWGSIPPFS